MSNKRRSGSGFGTFMLIYIIILVAVILVAAVCMFFYAAGYDKTHPAAVETTEVPVETTVELVEENAEPSAEPTPEITPEPTPEITPEPTAEPQETKTPADADTTARLQEFMDSFMQNYVIFFGTKNDGYYWELCNYVKEGSDLHNRMDLALTDRAWINTWGNEIVDPSVDAVWQLEDGSYEVQYSAEIIEHSDYWTGDKQVTLHFTIEDAPESTYGFLVTSVE